MIVKVDIYSTYIVHYRSCCTVFMICLLLAFFTEQNTKVAWICVCVCSSVLVAFLLSPLYSQKTAAWWWTECPTRPLKDYGGDIYALIKHMRPRRYRSECIVLRCPTCLQNISKQNEELIRTANMFVVNCGCSCRSEQLWEVEGMYSIWSSSRSIVFCGLDTRVSLHCEGTRDTVASVTTEPVDLTWTEARLLLFVLFNLLCRKIQRLW